KHFELIDHTDYELTIKEALTIKPGDFKIRVKNKDVSNQQSAQNHKAEGSGHKEEMKEIPSHGTPLLILYGSNLGTAEGIAEELADIGRSKG
ncbi:hypothetical protein, partial [Bacillus tropicus]